MSRRVTIRDVARLAHTSVSTVSAAFSTHSSIAPETRQRVLEAANQLGWRADRRASQLRRSDYVVVGVVYEVQQAFQAQLVDALYAAAGKTPGVELFLAGATAHHSELECLRLLLTERCTGLMLTGAGLASPHIIEAARTMPVMSLCRSVDLPGVDEVYSDPDQGEDHAIEHLVSMGHRDIWFASAPGRSMGEEREAAFSAAMERRDLTSYMRILRVGDTVGAGVATADAIVEAPKPPTAVVAYNDMVGAAIVRRLRQRGIRVPEDVSVVGYDDTDLASDPTIELTTIYQPGEAMAAKALELLNQRMTSGMAGEGEEQRISFPARLVIRSSTGPVRQ